MNYIDNKEEITRKETEKELGRPVTSKDNYLDTPEQSKRRKIGNKKG